MSFKSARLKAGKTVQDVVRHMGVTDGAVYMWENGYASPGSKRLPRLAEFYGTTVDELLRKEDSDAEGETRLPDMDGTAGQ